MTSNNATIAEGICNELFDSVTSFSLGTDSYEFRTTNAIEKVHKNAIRFGRTSNISVLYSTAETEASEDAKKEYVMGVLLTSIVICSIVMIWFMFILTFKLLGPQRVGILSGKRYHKIENKSNDVAINDKKGSIKANDQDAVQDDNDINNNAAVVTFDDENNSPNDILHQHKYRQQLICLRIAVLCCSVGIVVCIILNIIGGVRSLQQASQDVVNGLQKSEALANEAATIITNFVERQTAAFNEIGPFINNINEICPKIKDSICTSIEDYSTCNFTNIPVSIDFQAAFEYVVEKVDAIPSILAESESMTSDLEAAGQQFADAADTVSSFSWAFGVASFFSVLLMITNIGISYGIIAAWRQEHFSLQHGYSKQNCQYKLGRIVRHNLMVPIFCILVVICWIFSMVFVIGSVTSSDLCYDSPDDTVVDVLEQDVLPLSSTMQRLAIFYVTGCPKIDLSDHFQVDVNSIFEYGRKVKDMREELRNSSAREILVEQCGANPELLDGAAAAIDITLCNLGSTFIALLNFLKCSNWRPLYRLVAYDAVCFNGNEGFYFVALTQFLVVIFAMIMVTFRVAFRPEIQELEEAKVIPHATENELGLDDRAINLSEGPTTGNIVETNENAIGLSNDPDILHQNDADALLPDETK